MREIWVLPKMDGIDQVRSKGERELLELPDIDHVSGDAHKEVDEIEDEVVEDCNSEINDLDASLVLLVWFALAVYKHNCVGVSEVSMHREMRNVECEMCLACSAQSFQGLGLGTSLDEKATNDVCDEADQEHRDDVGDASVGPMHLHTHDFRILAS